MNGFTFSQYLIYFIGSIWASIWMLFSILACRGKGMAQAAISGVIITGIMSMAGVLLLSYLFSIIGGN